MLKRLAATLPLFLILFATVGIAAENDGKLLVSVERVGDSFRVVSAVAYPDAPAPVKIGGNARYRLLGTGGSEIAFGKVQIPAFIAQEYIDESGHFHGHAERVERFTLSLPLSSGIERIELKRGNARLLNENISPELFAPRRAKTASTGKPVSFAPLLKALTAEPRRAIAAKATAAPAKKDRIKGTIAVKGVKDLSLIRTQITFYPTDAGMTEKFDATSDENGEFKIRLPRGTYRILAYSYYSDPDFGGEEVMLYPGRMVVPTFDSSTKSLKLKWKKNTLFTGQLKHDGESVPGEVFIVDRINRPETHQTYTVARMQTDEAGRFAIRLPRKKFVMIGFPRSGSSAGEKLNIIKVKKSNVDVPVSLPTLGDVGGDDLKKIWDAGPESSRLNIVFLSEAYTEGFESFTDVNGNGSWDGDLLLDLNNNGVRDDGEYFYDRNANRVYDPPEPFEDLNGDGICNRFERARFELDAAVATAAMLDFPPFDRYTDVVNVYTHWTASEHGAPRLTQFSQWQNMNTAWDVYGTATDGFQSSRIGTNPKVAVQSILPAGGTIVPVVLSHDPINVLRANAQFGFGRVLLSAGDHRAGAVLIHELGHSIANLWDEYRYSTSPNQYFGSEPPARNVTKFSDPGEAKWSDLLDVGVPVPTPENQNGYGLFAGAANYSEGIYRSTAISMMRSTSYPFFIVNERAMAATLELFR